MDNRPSFAEVATMLAKGDGDPPKWLINDLAQFAPLIGYRTKAPDNEDLPRAIEAIDFLENELCIHGKIEERFGVEMPDCVDAASNALVELRKFISQQIRPSSKGGPIPDGRRKLCAGICADAWHRLHGKRQPYNPRLQEACELYWQACGQPETSEISFRNWERFLDSLTTT